MGVKKLNWLWGLILLASCPEESPKPPETSSPSLFAQNGISAAENLQRGVVIMGPGLKSFKPCQSNIYFPIEDQSQTLQEAYLKNTRAEFEPLYLEGQGKIQNPEQAPEAHFILQTIQKIEPLSPTSDCFPQPFFALGYLPEWKLMPLGHDEVIFTDYSQQFPIAESLVMASPQSKGQHAFVFEFTYRTPEPARLKLVLAKQRCQLQGKIYAYLATIDFQGKLYQGCAVVDSERLISR